MRKASDLRRAQSGPPVPDAPPVLRKGRLVDVSTLKPLELLTVAHKGVNMLSGSMVLTYRTGPTANDFSNWAAELRILADRIDPARR